MSPPDDSEGLGTWNEERRLYASNLRSITRSLELLSARLEIINDNNRDRSALLEKQINDHINVMERALGERVNKNSLDIAMLEAKAKTWGAVAGFLSGLVIAAVEFAVKAIK